MPEQPDLRYTLTSLWFRLMSLAILACVFYEALDLARGKAQGWSFYLTGMEVAFEVLVRLIAASLVGLLLGTVATASMAPILWYFKSCRERLAHWATKAVVLAVVFVLSRHALLLLIKGAAGSRSQTLTSVKVSLLAFYLAFAVALCVPRSRKGLLTSFDGMLSEKMTRRTALVTVVGTAGLVATEYVLSKKLSTVKAALTPQRPKTNILLITFDALSAEDMSLYGRALPTTPNIDAFARKGTVFTKYFSASTFTTPGVATMMTGLYPSESHVYQLDGRVRAENAERSTPHLMRNAGYATGAVFSNPFAYYFAKSLENEFDALPELTYQQGGLQRLWDATSPLHQDSGIGSRIEEYCDLKNVWDFFGRMPGDLYLRCRAVESFEQSQRVLAKLSDGFFLWVHVMTPHAPYLPDVQDRGRFIPYDEQQTLEQDSDALHYEPDQQRQVDRSRLLYDEFIVTADRAFGAFMAELENSGKLRDTTVIVSADHGESFEGGVYQHGSPFLTRPVIHIPLIIRRPGQQEGSRVAFTADQTALAPTILELAGQPRPNWMRGQSLVPWLDRNGQGEGEGLAFTQYLAKNSVFKPLRHGTVSVIDRDYQYVVYLDTQKGELRLLNEAQIWSLDRSAENPARAEALRTALHSRFPDLVQKTT